MEITNEKRAVNLRIQKSIALLILIIAIGLIYFANVLPQTFLGLSNNEIAILILAAFFIYFLFHYIRNHNYIYYSDTGNKLILRYFSLRPLEDKKNSIEFNKKELYSFEIDKKLAGFNRFIVLYRNTNQGVVKYPPVSITAMDNRSEKKLIAALHRLILTNQAGV